MNELTIGQCLDYIQEWIDNQSTGEETKKHTRRATQADFNNF